ncbi:MAG: OB-fold domain-containing protein [Thermoplasmata archaeon]|nr:OB-fold domain-containing protein [Thermoplasmata archaeon]
MAEGAPSTPGRKPSTVQVAQVERAPDATASAGPSESPEKPAKVEVETRALPFLLDFLPLQDAKNTRLSPFFDALRLGRLTTTRCRRDLELLWPPRVACPTCHGEELEWVDLPSRGHLYAFSAVLAGAPLGMESELPFVVGLVDLESVTLRLFGRVVGVSWQECRVGQPVRLETYDAPGGRVFYRFRAE